MSKIRVHSRAFLLGLRMAVISLMAHQVTFKISYTVDSYLLHCAISVYACLEGIQILLIILEKNK